MTNSISYPALAATLGVALVAGSAAAKAQTVITRDAAGLPVATTVITQQPVQTVQTTETIRTVRPRGRVSERRVVTTRRTVVSEDMMPAPLPAQPLYDVVTPATPVVTAPAYPRPLYDTVVAPTVDDTVVGAAVAPVVPAVPAYRYVYEPDRILVIDPVTNIAVQSIPR